MKGISEVITSQKTYTKSLAENNATKSYYLSRPELTILGKPDLDKDDFKSVIKFGENLELINNESSLKLKEMFTKKYLNNTIYTNSKKSIMRELGVYKEESNKICGVIKQEFL